MTRRNKSSSGARSLAGTLLAVLVLIGAVLLTQVTGIDFVGMLTGTYTPTQVAPQPTFAPGTPVAAAPGQVTVIGVPGGFGAQKDFWQVYFTAPSGSGDRSTYTAGIDTALASAIDASASTLDIAAYEFDNPRLTQAVLAAHGRGVRVRVVVDDEAALEDEDSTVEQFIEAGISVVSDERSGLMHNKFMILDGATVWTGSWNYTVNDTYRNNNNALAIRSQRLVANYQAEFDEMFAEGEFGPRSPAQTPFDRFTVEGTPIEVHFAPEDDVDQVILREVAGAQASVRFMAFSFTLDAVGAALLERAAAGVDVSGIYETTGSETQFSTMTPLFCAGLPVRQDGNPYIFHHKVFVIDGTTVLTGSFNFSSNATRSNDENLIIIRDPDLASQYLAEFERRWAEAVVPTGLACS